MMNKRSGFTIVEVLVAFLILIFAISITVLASSWIVNLEKKAMIKSDIFDVAYSYAEESMSSSGLKNSTVTLNGFTYSCTFATSNAVMKNFFTATLTTATLTVELNDPKITDEEYTVDMLIIPQKN